MNILQAENLSISFTRYTGWLRREVIMPVRQLDLTLEAGEITAVVGASGSGKSLLAHAILGILPVNAKVGGSIRYRGEILTPAKQARLRGEDIILVPQSVTYLDPLMRSGTQVRLAARSSDPLKLQREAFRRYRLEREVELMYPHQLSGGMARRIMAASAFVSGARLIIADEPTPGMQAEDVAETMRWFRELADQGHAVLLITHDLESAVTGADKIAVMNAGMTVEWLPASHFSGRGEMIRHPYSRALWNSLPANNFSLPQASFRKVSGGQEGPGCPLAACCELATARCREELPGMREVMKGWVRCHAS
ncbi:ATP-binding cassette domain-containing protein [Paenibacillus tarimensis]|uniref:ATP-binding cassette domain-containing protein n=1 Tax=Paenibacillus tarimensis TaxID=416012 RepID=UPI001F174A36|nr:ABC transporter ATP-binding protein [Paenibacillus tarimensis]MCF2944631.1 ABC transporter ATP-binding protein [Paenibacillus tarimensis]